MTLWHRHKLGPEATLLSVFRRWNWQRKKPLRYIDSRIIWLLLMRTHELTFRTEITNSWHAKQRFSSFDNDIGQIGGQTDIAPWTDATINHFIVTRTDQPMPLHISILLHFFTWRIWTFGLSNCFTIYIRGIIGDDPALPTDWEKVEPGSGYCNLWDELLPSVRAFFPGSFPRASRMRCTLVL